MNIVKIMDKVVMFLFGLILFLMISFVIAILLINFYQNHLMNGTELWICMVLAFGITICFDLESEADKKRDRNGVRND
ncbi:hypothetical protein ABFV99_13240 [Cytobacillus horneckiae]|uniref:hypothetical protein n=1 Tax=Cytobacillus horneckiae TaxID=549687 RepID=UPI0034CDC6DD